jgi:hypothetical protein
MNDDQVEGLIELAEALNALACDVIGERQEIGYDDHFGFMLLTFLLKQLEHMKSIIGLSKSGNFKDTAIIARTMLEGFAYLQWASHRPEVRAYRWRAFGWLVDFRNIQEQEKLGEKVNPEYKRRVENEIKRHCEILLKPRYLQTEKQNLPADPYIQEWTVNDEGEKVSPRNILTSTDIQLSLSLKNAFEKTSKRIHWQPQDLSIEWKSNEVIFSCQGKADALGPCSIAIFTLSAILCLVIDKFNLKADEALKEFDNRVHELSIKLVETFPNVWEI